MRGKITKRSVDALVATAKDYKLWDTEDPGLGVKITPRGHKSFVFQYWAPGRNRVRRLLKLGDYGSPVIRNNRNGLESVRDLTADLAREIAREYRADVQRGGDPAGKKGERRKAAKNFTVSSLSSEWLDEKIAKKKARTSVEYARILKKYILPEFGPVPVDAVQMRDVSLWHVKLRRTPVMANRCVSQLNAFLTWCEQRGRLPSGQNPCVNVGLYEERSRERYLSFEEITRLGEALKTAETVGLRGAPELRRKPKDPAKQKHKPKSADTPRKANPFGVGAIRLLLLTGWRENEVLGLAWKHVDLSRGAVVLPDTKTGRSVRPLGSAAVALLKRLPRLKGSPYVIPGAKSGSHLKEIRRLWCAVRHATDLKEVRLHDVRHTFASHAVGSGASLYITGKLLGHSRAESTRRYAHLADDVQKAAADKVTRQIQAALDGKTASGKYSAGGRRKR